jgi:hypothetical protein
MTRATNLSAALEAIGPIEGRRDRRATATAYHCRDATLRWERAS